MLAQRDPLLREIAKLRDRIEYLEEENRQLHEARQPVIALPVEWKLTKAESRALLALPDRLGSKLHVIERAVLHHAVEACGGNKSAAARLIGVDRKALERRWERLGDESEPPREPTGDGE